MEERIPMNIKRIEIVNEFLTEQMNHWMLFPLLLTVMGVMKKLLGTGDPSLALWALCSLIPLAFFVFRCKVRNLLLFLLAHLGTAVLVFALSGQSILTRVACTACVIGYIIHSLLLRLKHSTVYSEGMPLAVGVVLSAFTALFQYYQGTRGWENYYNITLIGVIALYFVIYFMDHYLDFLSMNKSSAGFLPAAEMFHSGMGLVLGYTLAGIGILVLSTQFEWLAGILRPIGDLLLKFLRFLFSRGSHSEEVGEIAPAEMPYGDMGGMGLPPGEEPFWLWEVLEFIAIVLFGAAALIGVGVLLWKLFKLVQKYMVFRYQGQEIQTGEAYDFREKCEIEKNRDKKISGLFTALSPRERIRKLYKKKLTAATARMDAGDKSSLGLYTAREWERKLDVNGMADLYEQARYSDREITGADVKRMKEIWK